MAGWPGALRSVTRSLLSGPDQCGGRAVFSIQVTPSGVTSVSTALGTKRGATNIPSWSSSDLGFFRSRVSCRCRIASSWGERLERTAGKSTAWAIAPASPALAAWVRRQTA